MNVLLFTAPMVQINCPYPSTPYLLAYLESRFPNHNIQQTDPAIDLVESLFHPRALEQLLRKTKRGRLQENEALAFFHEASEDYLDTCLSALEVLRNPNHPKGKLVATRSLLPEGPSFQPLHNEPELQAKFKELSPVDKAVHIATLYLDDLALYFRLGDDPDFSFSRYGERLAASQSSFQPLLSNLTTNRSLLRTTIEQIAQNYLEKYKPDLVGISVPFSGCVLATLQMGKIFRLNGIPVAMGGGYVNTELRSLEDPRIFDFVDYISFDDGEKPFQLLIEGLSSGKGTFPLLRTMIRKNDRVEFCNDADPISVPFSQMPPPKYRGLEPSRYIPMVESLNPVTRLWTGQYWNKFILAHGCYWRKCTFCDTSLPYIGDYQNQEASIVVDKLEAIIQETGRSGFHFVDEAAPPALLASMAQELIRRKLEIQWWGNIRFDKSFNFETAKLLKQSGCIAVTGGLEVASPRLLSLIKKGVTIEQVAKVTRNFHSNGVFVHAYLMYGFPTQTVQETVDSLEVVRQLFHEKCLQSAFWHRFAATIHSPVGKDPAKFGIQLIAEKNSHPRFAQNDLPYLEANQIDHDTLGLGLRAALYNFMHGIGLDWDVRQWFKGPVPKAQVPQDFVANILDIAK